MKRIVIVGASSGLGRAIAENFASKGWRVGIAARRGESLAELQGRYPNLIEYKVIDITDPMAPSLLNELIDALGGMDVFLQAAGVGKQNPDLTDEIERKTLLTNCVGFAAMVDTAFNYFKSHPGEYNQLCAITSVAGTKGLGMAASYSASKRFDSTYLTALEQLARLSGMKLSVTDIRPGFIATDLLNPANHYPMLMTVDHAVPLIVKAIEKRRRVAVIDRRWWWLVQAWKLIPRFLWVRFPAKTKKE